MVAEFPDLGVSARTFPEEVLRTLQNAAREVLDEEAAADADFKAVLDSQRAYQAVYGKWRRLAYLPKDF